MKRLTLAFLVLIACQSKEEILPPEPVFPIPSERQLAWHALEYYAFVHFNMNTFSDREWGYGDESPSMFDPSALDTRQWARIVKEAGMKGIIITAKHHDGFCLWPSAYTEHSVKNSPWRNGKGDLIQELKEACEEYGLKMGIYYSPWDRNHPEYGQPAYVTYMRNQLTELLSNYGELFEIWFDGANGGSGYYGGADEERMVDKLTYYDWPVTYELVRQLQPNAVMFSDAGPDVRWVGNEKGFAYETTWSNLMRDSVYAGMPDYPERFAAGQENGSHWVPAEADVSIRPGWYYHESEDDKVKTLEELSEIYYHSIGRNAALLINFPVDRRGLIHENDEVQILKLSEKINRDFENDLGAQATITASNERGRGFEAKNVVGPSLGEYWAAKDGVIQNEILLKWEQPITFNRFLVQEFIPLGQRVKSFILEAKFENKWIVIHRGTTIGAKRILRFDPVQTTELRFTIQDAKASPTVSRIGVFFAGD
jgi:alpha-L-fucosidase